MKLVGEAELSAIDAPLRGGSLGFGLTTVPASPVHNRGSLSAKGG
jgi:hypothetical protein